DHPGLGAKDEEQARETDARRDGRDRQEPGEVAAHTAGGRDDGAGRDGVVRRSPFSVLRRTGNGRTGNGERRTMNIVLGVTGGIADDALSTYAIAHRREIQVAPAMNWSMLQHATVVQNLETLRGRGVDIIDPASGPLAEGEEGAGRLADIPVIAERVRQHFRP